MNVFQELKVAELVDRFAKLVPLTLADEDGAQYPNAAFLYVFTTQDLIHLINEVHLRSTEVTIDRLRKVLFEEKTDGHK